MSRDWEAQLQAWARPPGQTEQDKMERAEREIRAAIDQHPKLQAHSVTVRAQGSYYNRTSVPGESDVDVRAVVTDVLFDRWEHVDPNAERDAAVKQRLRREANLSPASYPYSEFKDDVGIALVKHFGPPPAVIRGNKAYDIHETSTRVESDCLPGFESRLYGRDSLGRLTYREGVEFTSDSGERVLNFPEQQHREGIDKHTRTHDRFKKMVRILKNLRNEMNEAGVPAAKPIPSFLSECLVWNVPDDQFPTGSFKTGLTQVLLSLSTDLADEARSGDWHEENDIKFLFRPSQPWTLKQASDFIEAALVYFRTT